MTPHRSQRIARRARRVGILVAAVSMGVAAGFEEPGVGDAPISDPPPSRYKIASPAEEKSVEARESELDPRATGWASEALHSETQSTLSRLAAAMVDGDDLRPFLAADAAKPSAALRPKALEVVFKSSALQVARPPAGPATDDRENIPLIAQLEELRDSLGATDTARVRFKQYHISPPSGGKGLAKTTALYKAMAPGKERSLVQNAVWELTWDVSAAAPKIRSIEVSDFEELTLSHGQDLGGALFHDRTQRLLGGLPCYRNLIEFGANERIETAISEGGRALVGIAVGDANGDGRDDVFCPQPEHLPNLLLLSQPGGGFVEVGAGAGLDWLDPTAAALFADFDNDGDQDLAIATTRMLVILSNDGDGMTFTRRAQFPQQDSSSLCSADYDGDGLLDLFVCNYLADTSGEAVVKPDEIYDSTSGGTNRLYRNTGDFGFADVTQETGLHREANRLSLAAAWEDYDDDGDPDLYVANDFGRNCLYRNDVDQAIGARTFREVGRETGADDPSTGMSVTWGDVDRDGRMDACVGNMFSAAGNRITLQPKFRDTLTPGLELERVQYLARGNTLLMGRGDGSFSENSVAAGVINTQWTWGTQFGDVDNSGSIDLLAVNGFITGRQSDDL